MPRLGGAYCFRRVRSQRKSVDWGTMGPALGGAYERYAHISSLLLYTPAVFSRGINDNTNSETVSFYADGTPIVARIG